MKRATVAVFILLCVGAGAVVAVKRVKPPRSTVVQDEPQVSSVDIFPGNLDPNASTWTTDWSWDSNVLKESPCVLRVTIRPWGGLSFRTSGAALRTASSSFLLIELQAPVEVVDAPAVSLEDQKASPCGRQQAGRVPETVE